MRAGIKTRAKKIARRQRKKQSRLNKSIKKMLCENKVFDICCYCHVGFLISNLTVEHIIPLSLGGSNQLSNIDLACRDCNSAKGRLSYLKRREENKLQWKKIRTDCQR